MSETPCNPWTGNTCSLVHGEQSDLDSQSRPQACTTPQRVSGLLRPRGDTRGQGRSLGTQDPLRNGACGIPRNPAPSSGRRVWHREILGGSCVRETPYRSPLSKARLKVGSHVQYMFIGCWTGNGVVIPTVLPTVGRRAPTKKTGLGPLRPTVGNTFGITTPFSIRYPIKVDTTGKSRV